MADSLVLTLRARLIDSTMTWTTDGQTYTATNITGSTDEVLRQQLTLTGTTARVAWPQVYPQVNLYLLSAYQGLGTYPLNGIVGSAHYHLLRYAPPGSTDLWADYRSSLPVGGTVTVTTYAPAQGLLGGTFRLRP